MKYSPPPAGPAAGDHPVVELRGGGRFSGWLRGILLLTGCLLVVPLGIATQLTPSSRGLGTHQQLGLPPCSMVQIFGIRCPACGMTTSWSLMVRGRVLDALRTNSGGALLAVIAAGGAPWLIGSGIRGRWIAGPPSEMVILTVAVTVMAVTLVDWLIRLQL